jgi:hypothetical protein
MVSGQTPKWSAGQPVGIVAGGDHQLGSHHRANSERRPQCRIVRGHDRIHPAGQYLDLAGQAAVPLSEYA